MQFVKIQIPDRALSARGSYEMAHRGRNDCYLNDVYIVSEPALKLLDEMGITYREFERGDQAYAEKTLRDTLAR